MDRDSSVNGLDISDPISVRLSVLGCLCREGNGYAAFAAYRLCQESGRDWPQWLVAYFDDAARFLLDEYARTEKRDREIEKALGLNSPEANRAAFTRSDGADFERRLNVIKAALPSLVDDYARKNRVKTQTAIKDLAKILGFENQWTRLRDAYDKVKSAS